MRKLFLIPSIIMGIILSSGASLLACNSKSMNLENSSWILKNWDNQGSIVEPESKIYLSFKNNQINGSGGCNNFGGTYKIVDNKLIVESFGATRIACNPLIMNQESQLFSALQSLGRVNFNTSGSLVLHTNTSVFYFNPNKIN
ncbi:META domain-containing protein [Synechocystis sp. PCC 7509]|uniref:META domain-containing protein n=1 Tax=Synechocystis sp. PCC 7509 TaxID=927677 RepID=UPI0002AD1A1E|nr:META domain-containing protein [Synechocystis sp. PCC 7509]